jgi:hypothetical protein
MSVLVAGGLRQQFWPPRPHITHLHAFTTVVGLLIRITAFVLLTSIVAILSLLQLRHEDAPGQVIGIVVGLLGVFLLYWLNTLPVREFFTRGGANIGTPSSPAPGS